MCSTYPRGGAARFVRLCARTSRRGEHVTLEAAKALDPLWMGVGCVKLPRPNRTDASKVKVGLPQTACLRCGGSLQSGLRGEFYASAMGECFGCDVLRERAAG